METQQLQDQVKDEEMQLIIQATSLALTVLIILLVEIAKNRFKEARNRQLANFNDSDSNTPTLQSSHETWSRHSSKRSGDLDDLSQDMLQQTRVKKSEFLSRFSDS